MSRTDKDKPYWVRTEWYRPYHYCGWRRFRKYRDTDKPYPWNPEKFFQEWAGGFEWKYLGDCDLPAEPMRENTSVRWRARKGEKARCMWEAEWPEDRHMQMRGRRKKYWRHAEFFGPQRAAVRDTAREVIKGNHEMEFPDGRHRHSVLWDW